MNLADPELELVDPTPNVYALFINFDQTFFWSKLAGRAVVRWSKRMYSCAGICSYEGRGGLCNIALSEPLLKLRSRKDLIETLLHEMIHAYLFVTCQDQDRNGHGPNFLSHMHRINKCTGLNISIYHDFHDEVKLYQTHWWRCNGPCQHHRPRFGIVRRTCNRAPGPSDWWWGQHKKICGGEFKKIKEPENYGKKAAVKKTNTAITDIAKFVTVTDKIGKNVTGNKEIKPVLKNSNSVTTISSLNTTNLIAKSIIPSSVAVSRKGVVLNPQVKPPKFETTFNSKGNVLSPRKRSASVDVVQQVRNVWAKKDLPTSPHAKVKGIIEGTINKPKSKHSIGSVHPDEPTRKRVKIDDYFKKNAVSLLKDVYGQDFEVKSSKDGMKLQVVESKKSTVTSKIKKVQSTKNYGEPSNLVQCPVCTAKVDSEIINRHLDECLNKEVVEKLSKKSIPVSSTTVSENIPKFDINNSNNNLKLPEYLNSSVSNNFEKEKASKYKVDSYIPVCKDLKANAATNIKIQLDETFKVETNEGSLKIKKDKIQSAGICICCGKEVDGWMDQHLDECLMLSDNNNTVPREGANVIDTIVLDDDDEFNESLTLNATGTKLPCPCCFEMVEDADMNNHLEECLN